MKICIRCRENAGYKRMASGFYKGRLDHCQACNKLAVCPPSTAWKTPEDKSYNPFRIIIKRIEQEEKARREEQQQEELNDYVKD